MKAKLNKVDNGYVLLVDNIMYATDNDKLSKQNCDEIFGVVDLMKLAEENSNKYYDVKTTDWHCNYNGFFSGFQKAMELNKDKVFTKEDILNAIHKGSLMGRLIITPEMNVKQILAFYKTETQKVLESLQQPTEIEVEIEYMFSVEENGESTNTGITKLDENGCLILKRI
jgi:hypothetical protein